MLKRQGVWKGAEHCCPPQAQRPADPSCRPLGMYPAAGTSDTDLLGVWAFITHAQLAQLVALPSATFPLLCSRKKGNSNCWRAGSTGAPCTVVSLAWKRSTVFGKRGRDKKKYRVYYVTISHLPRLLGYLHSNL